MRQQEWSRELTAGIAQLELAVPSVAPVVLSDYVELLHKWNRRYNLTAVREPAEMLRKHVLDSLTVAPYLRGERLLDVGSGAGLPGIPLAVAFPQRRFVLLDSNGKKIRFVTHALAVLGLKNVEVVQARAEDFRPTEPFATVISRAFASLVDFLEQTAHLSAPMGRWLAMKGVPPDEELRNLPAGFRLVAVHPVKVPGLNAKRCVVEIKKS